MPNLKSFDVEPFIQQKITNIKLNDDSIIIVFTGFVNIYYLSLRKIYKLLQITKKKRDEKNLSSVKLQYNLDIIKDTIINCVLNYKENMVLYTSASLENIYDLTV